MALEGGPRGSALPSSRELQRVGRLEEQLELDLKFPILKPPEVLLQKALAHLTGTSDPAVSEQDDDDADEDAGMTEARKLKLLALYFSRKQWYRD